MGKYLKKFETENDRNTYENSESYIEPYVSYIDGGDVHYNKPPFFCRLTLSDDSVVEIEGSGELTSSMISSYRNTLVSAEIGTLCTSIGSGAFFPCTALTNVIIPDSVTIIGSGAFNSCSSLISVAIPNSVELMYGFTFRYCSNLTNVTIGSGITNIDMNNFEGCSSLSNITIPSGVTSIGFNAFYGCSGLTSIIVEATTPPTLNGTNVFSNTNNCPIYVPSASVDAYKAANGWSTYASRIQAIPTT